MEYLNDIVLCSEIQNKKKMDNSSVPDDEITFDKKVKFDKLWEKHIKKRH